MANATGWSQLMDGNVFYAAFYMYDAAFMGWFTAILFIVYQTILYMKTKNATLCWVIGLFFVSIFVSATVVSQFIKPISIQVMFVMLVFELASILYMAIFR